MIQNKNKLLKKKMNIQEYADFQIKGTMSKNVHNNNYTFYF